MKFYSKLVLSLLMGSYVYANEQAIDTNKTVFLTGAAGFIGSNFLRYMFEKYPSYHFLVLDKLTYAGNITNIPDYIKTSPRFEFFYGSVTNQHLVDILMQRSDLVVHFAAESHVTNSIYEDDVFFDTDVIGTRVMMRSLVKYADRVKRFIHISTSEVFGTALEHPMTEEHPLQPQSPYAAAKTGADRLVYAYWCTYNIPVVILRPFNNYGPNQHIEKVIPRFITNALKGKKLPVDGSGKQTRDWVHTHDMCRAVDKALHVPDFDKIKNQIINIGSGKTISILYIAKKIIEYLGLSDDVMTFVEDRPGQVDCHIASTEKSYRLLEWKAEKGFDEGLKEVVEWYKNNEAWWKDTTILATYLSQTAFMKNFAVRKTPV